MATNIYNPKTGQTGYQVPGYALPDGWQWGNPPTGTSGTQTTSNTSANNISDLIKAVQTGTMTQEQAYREAIARSGGSANEGGTTDEQQAAKKIHDTIYNTVKTYTTVNQSSTTGTGTTSSTIGVGTGSQANIYNPTTGATGYQVPGAAIPSGWVAGTPPGGNSGASGGGNTGSSAITNGVVTTGNSKVDKLQQAVADSIYGSVQQGFTIDPGLNIGPDVLAGFMAQITPQLDPKYQQYLSTEINNVNVTLGQTATDYLASQGKDVQDFQTQLAALLNSANPFSAGTGAAAKVMMANENRTLSQLDADTAASISQQLNAGGAQVGSGINGGTAFGTSVPGLSGNANSFNIPSLYGVNLSLTGGNTVSAGSSNQGNALNFNYTPSMYTTGAIPQGYSQDMLSQLNAMSNNYQQIQIANGLTNQQTGTATPYGNLTSSSGNTLPVTSPTVSSTPYSSAGLVSVPGIGMVSPAQAKAYGY